MNKGLLVLIVLAAIGGGCWYAFRRPAATAAEATRGGPPGGAPPAPVAVTAVPVNQRDVLIYLDGLGTVLPISTVTVRTQIDGQLSKVLFKEGQDVRKDDLLAEIDPRIYQAQLDQALAKKKQDLAKVQQDQAKLQQDQAKKVQDEANVRQAKAKKSQDQINLDNARVNLKRNQDAFKVNAISAQLVTDQEATVRQLEATILGDDAAIQAYEAAVQADSAGLLADEATVQADQATVQVDEAAINYAKTYFSYTSIHAPVDGRTGVRMVDAGNIVHANDASGLVVITQLEPISVVFTLPQQNLQAVNERLAQEPLTVLAVGSDAKTELDRGTLQLVDNQIDPATGTMRLKATFQNAQRKLWPGGFINVRLLLNTRRAATVVDAPAIQPGPDGSYVYVIKDDQTVEPRPVKIALIQDGQAIIESGLNPGEKVVLSGQDRLKKGALVSVNQPQDKTVEKPEKPEKSARTKTASPPGPSGVAK